MKLNKSTTVFLNLFLILLTVLLFKLLISTPQYAQTKERVPIYKIVDPTAEYQDTVDSLGVEILNKVKKYSGAGRISPEEFILNYFGMQGWKLAAITAKEDGGNVFILAR